MEASNSKPVAEALARLKVRLIDFKRFFEQDLDFDLMVNARWNAKDVLGHITFWHESFASVLKALSEDEKPVLLKGKIPEINEQGFQSTHNDSITALFERLDAAQSIISDLIVLPAIELIPYRKGSRSYTAVEHLEIVSQHIRSHLIKLQKAYKASQG